MLITLSQPNKRSTGEVQVFLSQRRLELLINEPTRVTDKTSSLLDIIVTDSPEFCQNIEVHHNPNLIAHGLVLAELKINKCKEKPRFIFKRYLDKINGTKFSEDLHDFPWAQVSLMRDMDDKVEWFNSLGLYLFESQAAIKRIRVSSRPAPWIADNIELMMSLRDAALSRARALVIAIIINH